MTLLDGVEFNEDKPAKSWGETFERTKTKAKHIVEKVEHSGSEIGTKIESGLIKSKLGNFWKKIAGPKEDCPCEQCRHRRETMEKIDNQEEQPQIEKSSTQNPYSHD